MAPADAFVITSMKKCVPVLAVFLLIAASVGGQEIPARVKYHRASEAVNAAAAKTIKLLLAGKLAPEKLTRMSNKVLIVGSGLWDALKKFTKLDKSTGIPVTFYVPYSNGAQQLEARGMKTPAQQRAFWAAFLDLLTVDLARMRIHLWRMSHGCS